MPDYIAQIVAAQSPEQAATLILANAAKNAASLICYSDAERLRIVTEAESRAQSLERPWDTDSGPQPWRKWLKDWGYIR